MKLPIEYCPECHSLKRKPNKECKNHDSYWIKPTPAKGGDFTLAKLMKEYKKIKRAELQDATESLAEHMVKTIANKHIKVQDTHEGRSHQRHWYLVAQKMLKKLVKEYERVCKEEYQ